MSDEDSIDAFLRTLERGLRDSGFGELETRTLAEHPALIPTAHLVIALEKAFDAKPGDAT